MIATRRGFTQFLPIAKGSAAEVQSQLYVALDWGYIAEVECNRLHELSEESTRHSAQKSQVSTANKEVIRMLKARSESEGIENDFSWLIKNTSLL